MGRSSRIPSAATGAASRSKICRRASPLRCAKYDWLDGNNACAAGASYGGFMINWIAGNWADRFGCLVNHDGIFDARTMYYGTEELWFDEWEHGGPYFEVPQNFEKFNPSAYVKQWQSPMLVIHGEQDFRVPLEQGFRRSPRFSGAGSRVGYWCFRTRITGC